VLWGDANVVNKIPGWIDGVTSSDIQRVVKTYLVPTNRTVIDRKPAAMIEAAKTAATSAPTTTAPAGVNK
jgi:zinc protease